MARRPRRHGRRLRQGARRGPRQCSGRRFRPHDGPDSVASEPSRGRGSPRPNPGPARRLDAPRHQRTQRRQAADRVSRLPLGPLGTAIPPFPGNRARPDRRGGAKQCPCRARAPSRRRCGAALGALSAVPGRPGFPSLEPGRLGRRDGLQSRGMGRSGRAKAARRVDLGAFGHGWTSGSKRVLSGAQRLSSAGVGPGVSERSAPARHQPRRRGVRLDAGLRPPGRRLEARSGRPGDDQKGGHPRLQPPRRS